MWKAFWSNSKESIYQDSISERGFYCKVLKKNIENYSPYHSSSFRFGVNIKCIIFITITYIVNSNEEAGPPLLSGTLSCNSSQKKMRLAFREWALGTSFDSHSPCLWPQALTRQICSGRPALKWSPMPCPPLPSDCPRSRAWRHMKTAWSQGHWGTTGS